MKPLNFSMKRRKSVAAMALTGLAVFVAGPATADYPDRPITLVVPNAPGGAADILARGVADHLSKQLAQPIVVENHAGASGAIAAKRVLRSAPDGYTLLFGTTSEIIVTPLTMETMDYRTADFTPIGRVGVTPMTIVASKASGLNSVDELIQRARQSPGELTVGVTGSTSFQAFAAAALSDAANIELISVPYRGGAPISNDILSGQLDLAVMAMPGSLPLAQSDRVTILGVLAPERVTVAPDLPSVNESAEVDGVSMEIWAGLMGPQDLPEPIVNRINLAIQAMLGDEAFNSWRNQRGDMPVPAESAQAFAEFVEAEEARFTALLPTLKFEP